MQTQQLQGGAPRRALVQQLHGFGRFYPSRRYFQAETIGNEKAVQKKELRTEPLGTAQLRKNVLQIANLLEVW